MTQTDKIIELMSSGEWIDMKRLNDICFRYSARLADLRAKGYTFEKRNEGSHYWYRIAPNTLMSSGPLKPFKVEPDGQILIPGVGA